MRSLSISAVVGIVAITAICESAAHSQYYYGGAVYYSSPRVAYYQSYVPTYYTRTVYYSAPVYYSYYEPQYVYYAPPVYCEPSYSYATPERSYETTQRPADATRRPEPAKPATAVTVGAYDNRFEPQTINVQMGTTVRWVNYGQHAHTVTANDDSWDSGDIQPGATYSATFKQPGTYYYYCRHHRADRMQGVIVVASGAGRASAGTASSGY